MPTWLPATVVSRRDWSDGLFSLVIDRAVPFRAGQFLTLTRDPDGGRQTKRAYSVASAPNEPLEFYIIEVDGGRVSPGLANLRPGDALFVSDRGKGLFTLDQVRPEARSVWLFSTGTGLAPYRSMLREGVIFDRVAAITLVMGVRYRDQLGYDQDFLALQAEYPGLRVVRLISREPPGPDQLPGRMTQRLSDGTLEGHVGRVIGAEDHVMLCGNPAMIDDMQELLALRGLVRHTRRAPGQITAEKYW